MGTPFAQICDVEMGPLGSQAPPVLRCVACCHLLCTGAHRLRILWSLLVSPTPISEFWGVAHCSVNISHGFGFCRPVEVTVLM